MTQTPRVTLATSSSRPTAARSRWSQRPPDRPRRSREGARGRCARDVEHRLERLEHRAGVGVQAPVAMLCKRVAPADREDLLPTLDQVLDVAAPGGEIGDIELVDHRRYEEDRDLPYLRGRRAVLDELEALVAENDRSRGPGQVDPDRELRDVDVGGQAGRLPDVPGEVPRATDEVPPAGVDHRLQHLGVEERSVCGRQRVDDGLRDEAKLGIVGPLEFGIVDGRVHRLVDGQVRLQQPSVDPAPGPGGIEEPAVTVRRLELRAAVEDPRELAGQRGAAPDRPAGTAREPRREPKSLAARQKALPSAQPGLRQQQVQCRAPDRRRVLVLLAAGSTRPTSRPAPRWRAGRHGGISTGEGCRRGHVSGRRHAVASARSSAGESSLGSMRKTVRAAPALPSRTCLDGLVDVVEANVRFSTRVLPLR